MSSEVATVAPFALTEIPALLRGEVRLIQVWIAQGSAARICLYVAVILGATAAFGWVVGAWRDPVQGLYTAIKFPLIVLLTACGNGLINGMLAPLLGIQISFRQSLLAVLISFTIAATVLGACAPLICFAIWNAPGFAAATDRATATMHSFIFVALVAALAAAGIAGNVRLFRLLRQLSGSDAAARRTLLAWLTVNLLLGSQLAWVLRPFVGAPDLPVEFLRATALEGNFFEALLRHAQQLFR